MSCCAADRNGCLDLRHRAFALGGQVSAEWSRCPGSMAPRARDSVAPLRRSSSGWMFARIGRVYVGVGRRHPVTIRKASLMAGPMKRYERCGRREECCTLLLSGPGLRWLFETWLLQHPNQSQQAASRMRPGSNLSVSTKTADFIGLSRC